METNRFQEMINGTFTYQGKTHVIRSVTFDEVSGMYNVQTDSKLIIETEKGMNEFRPHTEPDTPRHESLVTSAKKQNNDLDTVGDLLLKSMKKVQEDPKQIDQALALGQQAQVFINLKKLQLDIVKTVLSTNRKR